MSLPAFVGPLVFVGTIVATTLTISRVYDGGVAAVFAAFAIIIAGAWVAAATEVSPDGDD